MTITITKIDNADVAIDESPGLQKDDTTDALPTAFQNRLTALTTATGQTNATPTETATDDVITIAATGALGDIILGDSNGDPLNGVPWEFNSNPITTLDGNQIFLYTDSNNNIVLGREGDGTTADSSGDIVFALFLEEDRTVDPVLGTFWTALFEPLFHPDATDPDDFVDLTGLVHVTATEENDFSFAKAPSGQNLFMMFGTTSQAILVTGEDPANESAGQNVSNDGDTVNTGQGGGATTLGTEGQQIKAQKALVVTFVTGANSNFLVPNLSPTEATDETNIQFTGYVGATAAQFTISQMTPGNANTTATLEIQAYLTADSSGDSYINDNPLVQGDTSVNITSVQVFRGGVDVTGTLGVTVDLSGAIAIVTGVKDDDEIRYETDSDHNRVLIRNDQPASGQGKNVAFDLGGFTLTEVAGDTEEVGSTADFYDDGLTAIALTGDRVAEEDDLANANSTGNNEDASTNAHIVVTELVGLISPTPDPADDPQSFSLDGTTTALGTLPSLFSKGDAVTYTVSDGVNDTLTATADDGGPNERDVFTLVVEPDGTATFTLLDQLDHVDDESNTENLALRTAVDGSTSVVAIDFSALIVASDADGDSFTPDPDTYTIEVEDDIPVVAAAAGATATHDETAGVDTDADDTTDAAVAALFAGVTAPSADLTPAGFAQGAASVVGTTGTSVGADEEGTTTFTLVDPEGADSGLATTDGTSILLFLENGLVVGRIGSQAGEAAFAVALDSSTGVLSLAQYASLFHDDGTDPDDAVSIANAALQAAVSLTDFDGDTITQVLDIGDLALFEDDGPTAAIARDAGTLTHDETAGDDTDADDTTDGAVSALFSGVTNPSTDLSAAGFAQGAAAAVNSTGSSSGEDDEGATTVFSLALSSTTGVDSGLTTTDGTSVLLFKEQDLVVGRIGGSTGAAAFAVAIDGSTGVLSVAQYASLFHDDDTDPDDSVSITDTALQAVVTVTDGDGDTATNSVDIGDKVSFEDDGPAVTVDDLTGTFSTAVQSSTWDHAPGEDGFQSLEITLNSYTIDANPTVTLDTSLGTVTTPDANGNFVFEGSITDDFTDDGIDNEQTVEFTLTFDPDDPETYDFELTTPPSGVTIISTEGGSLDAGGPDPVRTLTVDSTEIVFSAVNATTAATDIQDDLNTGEAAIEASATYLSSAQMNVSTAGIGLGNNLFQGNANTGVDGATTQGGAFDESFVADPDFLFSSAKIFIDNSVGGYDNPPEELYYRVYESDGDVGPITLVAAADLDPESGGQVSFTIGDPNGPSNIDAIQLFMGRGDIKIPVIEFSVTDQFDPQPLDMDFTATLIDGDDDSSTDTFSIDLEPEVA